MQITLLSINLKINSFSFCIYPGTITGTTPTTPVSAPVFVHPPTRAPPEKKSFSLLLFILPFSPRLLDFLVL